MVFFLVRWLTDESVGVIPESAVKRGQDKFVGSFVNAKLHANF